MISTASDSLGRPLLFLQVGSSVFILIVKVPLEAKIRWAHIYVQWIDPHLQSNSKSML